MRLPSCVMNGAMVLPERSYEERKVATGGAIVYHQQGDPTKMMSYFPRFSGFYFRAGLKPEFTSFFAWSTTAW